MNDSYRSGVRNLLINGQAIARAEVTPIVASLVAGKSVLVQGRAGEGKTCVLAQTIEQLESAGIPHLALRLDLLTAADVSAQLVGRNRGLPDSPVVTLGRFAGPNPSV